MRSLCSCLLVLVLGTALPAAAQDWTVLPIGTTQNLQDITRDGISGVWVVGDSGYVFHSDAARTSFTRIDVGTDADLTAFVTGSNISHKTGGETGAFFFSSNGGTSWSSRPLPDTTQSYFISTQGSSTALAAGSAGRVYLTGNNGVSWTDQTLPVVVPLHGALGESTVVGDDGVILVRSGGVWEQRATGTTADLYAIAGTANSTQMIVGEDGTLLRRSNDGAYSLRPSGTTATLRDVTTSGQNANFVIVVGDGGTALKSTDNGATWCSMDTGTTADLLGVVAPTNNEYIAVGTGGLVLRTTNGGGPCAPVVVTDAEHAPGPAALSLSAAPNPASGAATITYDLDRPGPARLTLYDVLGRTVAVVVDGDLPAGGGVATFDVARLAPGSYLARLVARGGAATVRFTVTR